MSNTRVQILSTMADLPEILYSFPQDLYIVGGAIRDEFLGRPCNDIDLSTPASCEDTIKWAQKNNIPCYDIGGKKYGTLLLKVQDKQFEISTFKKEKSRHDVKPGTLFDDINRRDFTINSFARNIKTQALYFAGNAMEDLKNKVLDTVGDPYQRFTEDPIRILRALRFRVNLGFTFSERLFKVLSSPDIYWLLSRVHKNKIRQEVIKGLPYILEDPPFNLSWILGMFPHKNLRLVRGHSSEIYTITLAGLYLGAHQEAVKYLEDYHFSNTDKRTILKIIKGTEIILTGDLAKSAEVWESLRRFDIPKDSCNILANSIKSDISPVAPDNLEILQLPVNGTDLLQISTTRCEFGKILEFLRKKYYEKMRLENNILISGLKKEDLLNFAEEMFKSKR